MILQTKTLTPIIAAAGSMMLFASPAQAQWDVRVSPYVWASGMDGEASVVPSLPPAQVDDNFGDILDKLDIAFFGAVEARKNDFFLRGDIAYASVTSEGQTPGNLYSGVELTSETFNVAGLAGVVLYDEGGIRADVFAGGRYWDVSNNIDFEAGTQPAVNVERGKSFFDPLVGASLEFPITGNLGGMASASVGGFGVGADIEYGATAALFYGIGDSWGLTAGYRYLAVDYDSSDGFVYDIAQHGPFIGAYFDF